MANESTQVQSGKSAQRSAGNGGAASAPDQREALRAQAQALLKPGESIFQISDYPLLWLVPVGSGEGSEIRTLSEYGITSESAKSNPAHKAIIFDENGSYRFSAKRVVPMPRKECFDTFEKLAPALEQWLLAVPDFDRAAIVIGAKNVGRKDYRVDADSLDSKQASDTPLALLNGAMKKGLNLWHQGAANIQLRKDALAAAKEAGLPLAPTNGKKKASAVAEQQEY